MNYIKVSDIVNDLSALGQDYDRVRWLTYMIAAKQAMKDIRVKFLNDFKRVYIQVDQSTHTARLPFDYSRFRTISIIENCTGMDGKCYEKVIPLTLNPYINVTPQTDAIDACVKDCGCVPSNPVCAELANYEMICEEVVIDNTTDPQVTGIKQTMLKTCDNGDIIKEVSQPVQKWIEGDLQCDYSVEMKVERTLCDYEFDFTDMALNAAFPVVLTFNIAGTFVSSGALANLNAVTNYMESLGWELTGDVLYAITNSEDVYGLELTVLQNDDTLSTVHINGQCQTKDALIFPYTITSYMLNGVLVELNSPVVEITNQADLDSFWSGLGFTKTDDTHYTQDDSVNVYSNLVVSFGSQSPAENSTIGIIQTNCTRPLVNAGIENILTTDVLCNVPLKSCGCIEESSSCISTICSTCSPYLNCCQTGLLTDYQGWGYVPPSCPTNSEQPYNIKGTYNLDERNYLIYLDSVSVSKLLLAYDADGSCEGEYYLPDYTSGAIKAGIAFYTAQYDESITSLRRRELEINYSKEKTKLATDYTDVIKMADLINALKTRKTPY